MHTLIRNLKRDSGFSVRTHRRSGAFIVLALICLVGCLVFVCLSADVGYLGVEKTRMQNAVDAAALAAAQEITEAVRNAPQGTEDVTAYALASAREVAEHVAELNGVYVDKDSDVQFGQRAFNPSTGAYTTNWGVTPANLVKVTARRTNADVSQPDGKLRLFFAGITGNGYAQVQTQALAYIEARDIAVVHDFSRSMNFDSQFSDEAVSRLSDSQIVENLETVWNDLNTTIGTLNFTPQYLHLTQTNSGVTSSCTFKYDNLSVTTSATLKQVKVQYSGGSQHTFTGLSGTTADIDGTSDISTAWVTSIVNNPPATQTMTSNSMTVVFAADRKSAQITSSTKLTNLSATFTDGTTFTTSWSSGSGPTSYTYSAAKEIDILKLKRASGGSSWTTFDCSQTTTDVVHQFDDTNANVKTAFGLTGSYPFPSGSWDEFINHCRTYTPFASAGYREMYGGLTFTNYVLRVRSSHAQTPKLCQTRHYPFHCIKQGHEMFCEFLADLGFDDHVGMVSYDTSHRVESIVNETGIPYVNISANPLTDDYTSVNNLMKYKQANYYSASTNMGGGLSDGIWLLDHYRRPIARPCILLMTDGNSNTIDSGVDTSLPSGWNWNTLFDYNEDGSSDYSTTDTQKRYVLKLAYEAAQKGYVVHAMSVGADADRDLLKAVAHIGGGYYIDVPGGFSVLDMEEQVKAGFYKIASYVPPAKLMTE